MARLDLHRGEDLDLRPARAAIAVTLLLAPPLTAATGRWHVVLPGEPAVTYTLLFTRDGSGDATRLLLEVPGARLDLLSRQDPTERDSTESVTDVATKETFSRRLLFSGFEAVPACADVRPPDACLVFTGARGATAAGLSAFSSPEAPALRARLAALVTPAFDAKLTALAAVFDRSAELVAYGDDFLRLVWPERFPRSSGRFAKGARRPGCDFDVAFGYPCTEAERRRERSPAR